MDDAFRYEMLPQWLEDHLDDDSREVIESLSQEAMAADSQVAEFEAVVTGLTQREEEIPQTLLYRGMRDYQRSLVQRMRLNHQINLTTSALILDALWEDRD